MSKKYYFQHEDTGSVCELSVNVRPSRRWYAISKKAYLAHEAQANNCVQADGASRPRCTVCGTIDHHIDDKGRVVSNPPRR